jgi:hypothetical protein
MTGVMRHVSDILPLTYVTRIFQAPWLRTGLAWRDVAVALAIAVAAQSPRGPRSAGNNRPGAGDGRLSRRRRSSRPDAACGPLAGVLQDLCPYAPAPGHRELVS